MALLQHTFWPAISHDDVGCGTIVETHGDPSRSTYIASCFLELENLNQELKSKLRNDFISILNTMGNINLSSTPQLPSPSPTPPSRPSSLHDTTFITEAYSWLLDNIANPYPSSTVKTSLSQRYNCPLSAINSWFVNARRRMGWTTLCRDYFNNCRADALDAAYRVFVKEDPSRHLPADIVHALISVKVAAEELYSSTLTKSTLGSDLDTIVKDTSDEQNVPGHEQERRDYEGGIEFSKTSDLCVENQPTVLRRCYPSPDHSPSSFPVPALDGPVTDESENDVLPPTLAGRKRRLSSSESHPSISEPLTRLVKRPRIGSSSSANAHLSPVATSVDEFSENSRIPRSGSMIQNSTSSKTRKRRLSDADAIRTPKQPLDSMAGPCLHTVSDPLPPSTVGSEHSIDEWFKANFDALFALPPPADVAEPDLSTQWEVELFNNYILPPNTQEALIPPVHDNRVSSSTDLTAFGDLLQSLESDGFVAPPETVYPPTMAAVDLVSQGLPPLPDDSQIIDWTALLDDSSEPTSDLLLSHSYVNSALSEIDLSVLQLPQTWTVVS